MTNDGPLYPNQPLREVATEARFRGDLTIENIRADFQKEIRKDYPLLKVPSAQHGVAPSLQPFRFETDDTISGVQVAINSIGYFTRNYPGHSTFMESYESVVQGFFKFARTVDVTRIGWRYINAIPFTREKGLLPLSRIFQDSDIFGNALSLETEQLSIFIVKSIKDFRLNIKLESSKPTSNTDEEVILLDIDTFTEFEPATTMNEQDILAATNNMHDAARWIFENLITSGYREFLRGEESE